MNNPAPADASQKLSPQAWRYILVDQGLIAFLVTFAINYAIAWSTYQSFDAVPLHGEKSIVADVVATCFLLPFISCMIVTYLTRMELERNRFPRLPPFWFSRHLGEYVSQMVFPRAMVFGVLGRLAVAPVLSYAIVATGIEELDVTKFLVAKSLFAGAFAAIVCPFFTWVAMHDESRPARRYR